MSRPAELPERRVVFGWGGATFLCSDIVWELILEVVAERRDHKGDLEDLIQRRCRRLCDRPYIHLGLMSPDDAYTRLEARKAAREGRKPAWEEYKKPDQIAAE